MNAEAKAWWDAFRKEHPDIPDQHKIYASYAGTKDMTDELVQLYLDGKKYAGSGLVADYQTAGDPLPALGDYWIVLDSQDRPRVLCRTTRVDIRVFEEVGEEVASAEGEGDLSVAYWRKEHGRFWNQFLEKFGVKDLDTAEVVTEFFDVWEIKTSPPSWRRIPRISSKLF